MRCAAWRLSRHDRRRYFWHGMPHLGSMNDYHWCNVSSGNLIKHRCRHGKWNCEAYQQKETAGSSHISWALEVGGKRKSEYGTGRDRGFNSEGIEYERGFNSEGAENERGFNSDGTRCSLYDPSEVVIWFIKDIYSWWTYYCVLLKYLNVS